MKKDIMICGVGGQGTVLASKIIASAAMTERNTVHSAETIGMAQRGGSVTSHVRIGEDAMSPLIPYGEAELLIAFEPSEAVRNIRYLKEGGLVIVNPVPVKPVTSAGESVYDGKAEISYLQSEFRCIIVDPDRLCEASGSTKFFNIAVLGIAAGAGELGIKADTVREEIIKTVPERFKEKDLAAFEAGFEIGKKEYNNADQ